VSLRLAVLAAVAAVLAMPAQAAADQRVIAAPFSSGYVDPDVTIAPGEKLTFFNPDVNPHDVTSAEPGLFASETVGTGSEVPVTGADALAPGSYPFICSIHPYMKGTLTVGSGGPGGGGGSGQDRKAPKLSMKVLDEKISKVLDAGALKLRTKLDEPATVRVAAQTEGTKVAKARKQLDAGTARVAAKLTEKGERLLRGAGSVKLEVAMIAADAAGNAAKRTVTAKLR
jgi:plastocyanin